MRYLVEFRNKWGDVVRQALTTPDPIAEVWATADAMTVQGIGAATHEQRTRLLATTAVFAQIERPAPAVAELLPGATFELTEEGRAALTEPERADTAIVLTESEVREVVELDPIAAAEAASAPAAEPPATS